MGTRGTRVARASVLATAATAIAAATALAVTPPAGTFTGTTNQTPSGSFTDPAVKVVTKTDGRVTRFVVHQWRAYCQTGNTWTEDTKTKFAKKQGLPQDGDHFHATKTYKSGSSYVGHITATVRGHFTDATHAKGKFNINMTVTHNGNYIDTCSLKAHWAAHS